MLKPQSARILIVDDDALVRRTLAAALAADGHEITCAEDGHDALRALRRLQPDLIILDIVMPGMEGLGFMLERRRLHDSTPVLAISGGGWLLNEDYLLFARKLGARDVLAKPFSSELLRSRVAALLAEGTRSGQVHVL